MASGGVVVACAPEPLSDVLRPCSKLVSPAPPAEQICVRMAELLESLLQDRPGSPSPPASPTRSLSTEDLRSSGGSSGSSRPLFSTGTKPLNTACFDAIRPPGISLKAYLERIVKYSPCSPECFVIALVYIDRATTSRHAPFCLTPYNIHRVTMIAILLSLKYFEDCTYDNAYFARVAGVTLTELNQLELFLLSAINWHLVVEGREYMHYLSLLQPATPASR